LETVMAGASPAITTCRAADHGSTVITNSDIDVVRAVELHVWRGDRRFFDLDGWTIRGKRRAGIHCGPALLLRRACGAANGFLDCFLIFNERVEARRAVR